MTDELLDFSGQVALVTGGSRGLGREIALALAARGADVVIASRKLDACEQVADEIEALGRRALPYACHVGRWDELDGLVEAAYQHLGRIDILVNNAGMSPLYEKLTDVTEELFDKVVAVNMKAPFRLMALVGERMAASGVGSIVNMSSVAAVRPSPHAEPYGAAKAAVNALTRSFTFDLGSDVRVNSIIVGPFLTDISKAWDLEAFRADAEATMASGRGGEPHEIVGAALFLASRTSAFVTGTVMRVDGGCA